MRCPTLALSAILVLAGCSAASALALPFEESDYLPQEETTTYVERSLNRQAPLTIEHPPVPRNVRGRRSAGSAGIAGFCREGGTIARHTEDGRIVVREREVCDNVAPRTLWPGHTDPRPTWTVRPVLHRRVLRTKG